ncbi:MAG: prephenate dehydrogenase/arogenate dehydrogenase family protein [Lachnospiraceae bacterium]|nr:prephenate dehydrogenase/arogenate dehydrogenase family protein [Lachnospiraceae bacterium]
MKVGIIGYGSMGKMLLWKFSQSGRYPKDDLLVSNRTQEKLEEARGIAQICSKTEVAQEADIVFVCVRPVDMKTVLEEIAPALKQDALLVSLNGSIRFDMIAKVVDHKTAKVIPALTAEINRSQTIVCYNEKVKEADKAALKELLGIIGNVIEVPEDEVGMASELVSCMPGFIASIFDVICKAAQDHTAIPQEQIVRMVLNTMSATGDLMLQKGLSFEEVVSRVATKGGITEVGSAIIYDSFPPTAEEMFCKTLEKRKQTAEKAAEAFGV